MLGTRKIKTIKISVEKIHNTGSVPNGEGGGGVGEGRVWLKLPTF